VVTQFENIPNNNKKFFQYFAPITQYTSDLGPVKQEICEEIQKKKLMFDMVSTFKNNPKNEKT
jgi:hypothetical protein